jgi:tRNA pseudouridine-54 N-methylase
MVRLGGLPELLEDLKEADLVHLKEDGPGIKKMAGISPAGETAFILGDHTGMTAEEESLIGRAGRRRRRFSHRARVQKRQPHHRISRVRALHTRLHRVSGAH